MRPGAYKDNPTRYRASRLRDHARIRAKKRGLPFELTTDYVESLLVATNGIDPVFGVPFDTGHPRLGASLDRVIPDLGYVPGNVIVVSQRANNIKSDACLEEIETTLRFYKGLEV